MLAAAIELCVYDTAAGAAAVGLMGGAWRLWTLGWLAWAVALLAVYSGGWAALQQQRRPEQPAVSTGGSRAVTTTSATQHVCSAVLLQLALPLVLGWLVPW